MKTSLSLFISFALLQIILAKTLGTKDDVSQKEILFEGDMMMSAEKVAVAKNGGDVDLVGAKYNGYGIRNGKQRLWPKALVPYDLSGLESSFLKAFGSNSLHANAVLNAMAEIEKKTCIRFIKRKKERDYIKFIDGGYMQCYSSIGRKGGAQVLSLGFECFYMGTAVHEIMHALGFYHEQSRPDRDQYVDILWDNIKPDARSQFHKYSHWDTDSLGSPYDYDSIMHYPWNMGGYWSWTETIRPKKAGAKLDSVNSKTYLSKQDAWQINKLYECNRYGKYT